MPQNTFKAKLALAEVLKGGVIIDVTNVEQAKMAENAGARAIVVMEKISADMKEFDGIDRMPNLNLIKKIREAVKIPLIIKVRIGHFIEAKIAEEVGIDFIDESEILTAVDKNLYIDKYHFKKPFICGAENLTEALMRVGEGAIMLRTKGDPGSGNISDAVRHVREVSRAVKEIRMLNEYEVNAYAQAIKAQAHLVWEIKNTNKLPVPFFAAGGVVTPADAAMLMHLGCDGVFVGSGIFCVSEAEKRAKAIVLAVSHYKDNKFLAEISADMGEDLGKIEKNVEDMQEKLPEGGW